MPSDPNPAGWLLGDHVGESRWKTLVKMRFLDELGFHFQPLVPEGLIVQPGPPALCPGPLPASHQGQPSH